MKNIFRIIRTTIVGGIFFLLPLAFIIIISGKIWGFTQRVVRPLLGGSQNTTIIGIALYEMVAICLLLLVCLLAGLLAKTRVGKNFIAKTENSLLGFIPGYNILKSQSSILTGFEERPTEVVLARVDDGWQLSFLVEQLNDSLSAVYIPNSPDPYSGSVYFIATDKLIKINITKKQALACLRKFGAGAAGVLKNNYEQMMQPGPE